VSTAVEPTSRQRRARTLREQVDGAPDRILTMPRTEVLELLSPPSLDADGNGSNPNARDPERYTESLLAQHGLRATPRLTADKTPPDVRLEPTAGYAVQGAFIVALLATLVGFAGYWVYGIVFAITGALAMALVAWRFDDLRRWAPPVVPRGRLLGAAAASALILLAGLLVVLPIRINRTNGGDEGRAQALVASAGQLITAGKFADAKGLLFQAQQLSSHPKGIDDARAQLVVAQVQAALADQNRKDGIYDQAQRAAAAKGYARAIKLGRSIRGFRDIDQLVRAYRAAERRQAVGG
jgi:hypothetical protein